MFDSLARGRPVQMPNWMRIEPRNPRLSYLHHGPTWLMTGGDSVLLDWGTGLGGVVMRLRFFADSSLAGLSRVYTDLPDRDPSWIRTLATRMPCPASPLAWTTTR